MRELRRTGAEGHHPQLCFALLRELCSNSLGNFLGVGPDQLDFTSETNSHKASQIQWSRASPQRQRQKAKLASKRNHPGTLKLLKLQSPRDHCPLRSPARPARMRKAPSNLANPRGMRLPTSPREAQLRTRHHKDSSFFSVSSCRTRQWSAFWLSFETPHPRRSSRAACTKRARSPAFHFPAFAAA